MRVHERVLLIVASLSIVIFCFGGAIQGYGQNLDDKQLLQIAKASNDKAFVALVNEYAVKRSIRTWKSKDEQHSIRASYLGTKALEGKVVLLLDGKQEKVVSISSLSENDVKTIDRIAEIEKQLLAATVRHALDAFEDNNLLKSQIAEANSKIESLESDLSKAIKYMPSNRLATENGIPDINVKKLAVFGEEYLLKRIRMKSVSNIQTSTLYTSFLSQDVRESYVGFYFTDAEGELFQLAFAKKSDWGEFLLSLNKADRANLSGKVINVGTDFGILVDIIEKVPSESK